MSQNNLMGVRHLTLLNNLHFTPKLRIISIKYYLTNSRAMEHVYKMYMHNTNDELFYGFTVKRIM